MDNLKKLMDSLDPAVRKYLDKYVEATQKIAKQKLVDLSHELLEEFDVVKRELQEENGIVSPPELEDDEAIIQKIHLAEVWASMEGAAIEVNSKFNAFMEERLLEVMESEFGQGQKKTTRLEQMLEQLEGKPAKPEKPKKAETEEELLALFDALPKPPKGEMN